MKIHHLEVRNFRGFEHRSFDFSDQFNVLIGDNGSGKTTVLEALALGLDGLIPASPDSYSGIPEDNPDNFRKVRYEKNQVPTFETKLPLEIFYQSEFSLEILDQHESESPKSDREVNWSYSVISKNAALQWQKNPELREMAQQMYIQVSSGRDILLPVIAYYGTNRLWRDSQSNPSQPIETLSPGSRLNGYLNCLRSGSNTNQFLRWFKTYEIATLQRKEPIGVFEAVKQAIENCLMDIIESITFDILEDNLLIRMTDGQTLFLNLLSDGVRNMVAMVADIAYRAAVLNPHLGIEAAQKTSGIVLIDEIDLHLHPKWQRRVVEDLRRTFPEIQFFATTHSPFIVQSLRKDEAVDRLIDLNNPGGEPSAEYTNRSIEDIAENVMDVDHVTRNSRYQEMMETAERYYQLLQQANGANPEEIERLKVELDRLIEPYSDDVAYHAFLKMQRLGVLKE